MFKRVVKKVTEDIWQFTESETGRIKNTLLRTFKILILTYRGFKENNCYLKASALTFYTLFSVVPVVALAFAIAKGFGLDTKLTTELYARLNGQQAMLDKVIEFADKLLAKTQGGLIAGIGVVLLLWTIIKLFSNIEGAFNDIWSVKKGRVFFRKVTDYLSMFFICPILLVVSASFTAFLSSDLTNYASYFPKAVIILIPTFFSYLAIWILLTFVYRLMPNCKVKLTSAIIPAIIVGTLFNIIQFCYFDFQVFITKYNAIYGSFAALPLFLLWVQINWTIVLSGAQLSFYIDNIELHEFDYSLHKISLKQKKLLSLIIVKMIVANFKESDKPLNAKELAYKLKLPFNLTQEILDNLVSAKVISLVHKKDKSFAGYQPSRCITTISIDYVLSKLETLNTKETLRLNNPDFEKIQILVKNIEQAQEESDSNILIKDI
ncbi:MAG: YihY/virulence factor BrkB family protein [Lentisphaerota bacterium]